MATALQQRLLHLCAAGIGDPQDVADLAATDWARLLVMARRHRLGPLLHSRLVGDPGADAGADPGDDPGADSRAAGVPKPFAEAIAANFDKHSRRAVELHGDY